MQSSFLRILFATTMQSCFLHVLFATTMQSCFLRILFATTLQSHVHAQGAGTGACATCTSPGLPCLCRGVCGETCNNNDKTTCEAAGGEFCAQGAASSGSAAGLVAGGAAAGVALEPCSTFCPKTTLGAGEQICTAQLLADGCPGEWCKCGTTMSEDCKASDVWCNPRSWWCRIDVSRTIWDHYHDPARRGCFF